MNNVGRIVEKFTKYDVATQCACLVLTDYAALWSVLCDYFKGPKDLMSEIIFCEDSEERTKLVAELRSQLLVGPYRKKNTKKEAELL